MKGGNSTNGTPIQLYACHGGAAQIWHLQPDGTLRGLGGKCIDVYAYNPNDGAQLVLWDCIGGANQRWAFVP